MGPRKMVSFPYEYPISIWDSKMGVGLGNSMGPAYHFRGSNVLGGPGSNPTDEI